VGLVYLDSSALVKLVVSEPETAALRDAVREWPQVVSSVLARVEVPRALRRARATAADRRRGVAVIASIALIRLDEAVLEVAADLQPADLRSLDALHLATALSLGTDLDALVAYDRRLERAARAAGLEVRSPR
jgi:hypothetical protein